MTPLLILPALPLAYEGIGAGELELDLDIQVVEHPIEAHHASGGSDYLTCKTDSTCDDSDAC